jgi:putative ATPase
VALDGALAAARDTPAAPVPLHIRNAPTGLMKELGYGAGYQYAHNSPTAYIPQEYLPDELRGTRFYEASARGFERKIAERMEWWAKQRGDEPPVAGDDDAGGAV